MSASGLLDMLRRCHFPRLQSLEVVYQADNLSREAQALSLMGDAFHDLRILKLFRYDSSWIHENDVDAVCMIHIA